MDKEVTQMLRPVSATTIAMSHAVVDGNLLTWYDQLWLVEQLPAGAGLVRVAFLR